MERLEYRGYNITADSYQDKETGMWVARAFIHPLDEAMNEEDGPITWEKEFETKQQADDFAADGAQYYVDSFF